MRSRFADAFNHDEDAPDYDSDVTQEDHPVRAGYAALLDWVAETSHIAPGHDVLELGAGTGNLTARLSSDANIVAVDISHEMLALARKKVGERVRWVHNDLLAFFDDEARFDRVVSTYAVHHLAADEKHMLLRRIRECLRPGGRVVFGDLMFESAQTRLDALRRYAAEGHADVVDAIEHEFFWLLDESVAELLNLGFRVTTRRFSDLSWGLSASPEPDRAATSAPCATSRFPS